MDPRGGKQFDPNLFPTAGTTMSDRLQKSIVLIFGLATVAWVVWTQREAIRDLAEPEVPVGQTSRPDKPTPEQLARGETLARQHCIACHQLPTPEMLDAPTWDISLTMMLPFVGLVPPDTRLVKTNGFDRVLAAGVFPPQPLMIWEEWDLIRSYYRAQAPRHLPRPEGVRFAGVQTTF